MNRHLIMLSSLLIFLVVVVLNVWSLVQYGSHGEINLILLQVLSTFAHWQAAASKVEKAVALIGMRNGMSVILYALISLVIFAMSYHWIYARLLVVSLITGQMLRGCQTTYDNYMDARKSGLQDLHKKEDAILSSEDVKREEHYERFMKSMDLQVCLLDFLLSFRS